MGEILLEVRFEISQDKPKPFPLVFKSKCGYRIKS